MTIEELKKVPFKFAGHIAFSDEHQSTYYNEQYGFKMVTLTRCYDEGMRFGRTRRHFYYNGKWYKSLKKFLEAIKDVEFKIGRGMKILKFYADWCAPCKVLGQKLESANLPIPITEVDVEDNDDLVREYGIRNVPVTILLDDQGNLVKRWVGIFDINELKTLIK